ncbi:DegV family protein [Glutamicibacter sp. MNS18]|uniref:DegV family protein n=1 Tax=Glutamicibacter sp. MNS18 TaxID=2989817 RepID=UPI0022367251|nr:DegV family protein [Glutamicibacter sp. MNS18]MCW4464830.1 DegV family protein [Glutamicibacter sp. MNS18]
MSDRPTGSRAGWFSKRRPARGPARAKIGIVTDSSACLSGPWTGYEDFQLLTIPVIINDVVHQDDPEALLMGLAMGQPVRTSRPSPGQFMRAYRELAAAGCERIISVHISAALSGTYESALLAAGEVEVPVTVVDSRTVALALGFAVRRMLTARASGADFEELLDIARAAEDNTVFFAVPSLEQLRRGGRISTLSGVLGNLLSVKPILSISSGAIQPVEKPRTFPRAQARLLALAHQTAEQADTTVDVGVMHFGALESAEELAQELAGIGERPVVLETLPAVLAAHTGIGVIAVCVAPHYPQPDRSS